MNALHARFRASLENERGMSLVEVVVAISILAVLSTASLGVYLSGINTATAQQRREVAITVANSVLEDASLVAPASLYIGRSESNVTNLRNNTIAVPGVNQTYAGFQSPPVALTATVAPTQTLPVNGTDYAVSTVIGTCFQPKIGGSCTAPTGFPNQPVVPATSVVLTRIIVVVRWSAGPTCTPTPCEYHTATLVDRNADLTWNISG